MKILFVCSGNTCRSPLAEAITRRLIARASRDDVTVSSAGTNAWDGSPASDGALLVGMERGLDLSAHRSRLLTEEMVKEADLILVMAPPHIARVREMSPKANVKNVRKHCCITLLQREILRICVFVFQHSKGLSC